MLSIIVVYKLYPKIIHFFNFNQYYINTTVQGKVQICFRKLNLYNQTLFFNNDNFPISTDDTQHSFNFEQHKSLKIVIIFSKT